MVRIVKNIDRLDEEMKKKSNHPGCEHFKKTEKKKINIDKDSDFEGDIIQRMR